MALAASQWAGSMLQSTKQSLQSWTARKYQLPDKHVASQVLMYRQLLHTACRPNLTLSRDYQGTPAQQAVLDMPWWSQGILTTKKMVISYQNLLARLWIHGACLPFGEEEHQHEEEQQERANFRAPVPHDHWVNRLGFQQPDPVTDFRSGGILSLAMMVYLVESCPQTYQRFVKPHGDASVLPFGLTCINITDMMAKFLMLSKQVDRMDALLSQKPFWRMFADPHAMLTCQQVAMDLTAHVVVELTNERKSQQQQQQQPSPPLVTVFDFANILALVERRMEYDYLMAGPTSPKELTLLHAKNLKRYQQQSQQRITQAQAHGNHNHNNNNKHNNNNNKEKGGPIEQEEEQQQQQEHEQRVHQARMAAVNAWKDRASSVTAGVGQAAGNWWQKTLQGASATKQQLKETNANDNENDNHVQDRGGENSNGMMDTNAVGEFVNNAAVSQQQQHDNATTTETVEDAEDILL